MTDHDADIPRRRAGFTRFSTSLRTAGIVTIAGLAMWLVSRLLSATPLPTPGEVSTQPRIAIRAQREPESSVQRQPASLQRTQATRTLGHVLLTVTDSEGNLITAHATFGESTYVVHGSAQIPGEIGDGSVSAPGYMTQMVHVADTDLTTSLDVARTVRGIVFDAVTKDPVANAGVSLRSKESQVILATGITDVAGNFRLAASPAAFVLHCEGEGYVPACESLDTSMPGIALDGTSADLDVEVPLFPVYAALYAVENRTNLADSVLRELLVSRELAAPGRLLPVQAEREFLRRIGALEESNGWRFLYASVRTLVSQPTTLVSRGLFSFRGENVGEVALTYRPIEDTLRHPAPETLILTKQWPVGELEVVTPVMLRVAIDDGGISLGGPQLDVGRTILRLPHGKYLVGPRDTHVFLDPAKWRRSVRIPDQNRVEFPTTAPIGTIRLRKHGDWESYFLTIRRGRAELGVGASLREQVMPVDPGVYALSFYGGTGNDMRVIWRHEITIENGQELSLDIGPEPPK